MFQLMLEDGEKLDQRGGARAALAIGPRYGFLSRESVSYRRGRDVPPQTKSRRSNRLAGVA